MSEQRLVPLLSSFLGPGHKQGSKHYYFHCPSCHHPNNKLAVQITADVHGNHPWQCWHCKDINKTGGKTIKSLLLKFNAPEQTRDEIYKILSIKPTTSTFVQTEKSISLPKEFVPLYGFQPKTLFETNFYDQVLTYLIEERKLTMFDILKYNIGMCLSGTYNRMIVIPSYNAFNILNFFITRTPHDMYKFKYRNAEFDKTKIIPFENTINWSEPVILVEGPFDMISVKRNAIPLLGKSIFDTLMSRLLGEDVDKIYVCLDTDARKNAIIHCERLMRFGKEVYLVELDGKDPNEIGFDKVNTIIQNTYPLTYDDIIQHKLRSIE